MKNSFSLKMIAIVDEDFGIAKNGKISWSFKEDLAFFKEKTTNNIVIAGRITFFSIPDAPLKNRINYIISKSLKSPVKGAEIFPSLEDALTDIENKFRENKPEIWIIGGARLYNYALLHNLITEAFITQIHKKYNADKFINSSFLLSFKKEIIRRGENYTIFRYFK